MLLRRAVILLTDSSFRPLRLIIACIVAYIAAVTCLLVAVALMVRWKVIMNRWDPGCDDAVFNSTRVYYDAPIYLICCVVTNRYFLGIRRSVYGNLSLSLLKMIFCREIIAEIDSSLVF